MGNLTPPPAAATQALGLPRVGHGNPTAAGLGLVWPWAGPVDCKFTGPEFPSPTAAGQGLGCPRDRAETFSRKALCQPNPAAIPRPLPRPLVAPRFPCFGPLYQFRCLPSSIPPILFGFRFCFPSPRHFTPPFSLSLPGHSHRSTTTAHIGTCFFCFL